jgi:L-iditol 2-dehydrogenase
VDPATAALIEPFACVLRGQDKLHIQPGETVLVVGAGPIGVMHVMLAKLRGAGRVLVSELIPERLEQARRLGADRVINPAKEDLPAIVAEETQDQGIDVAIVAAPAPQAQEIVLELAATNGRINYFGGLPKDRPIISINSNLIHYKELLLTGTTACSTDDCRRAASIIASGRIDLSSLVGARFPLKDTVQAILATEAGKSLKVIVEP